MHQPKLINIVYQFWLRISNGVIYYEFTDF
nr:MAG TPA: hypothetical protein [Caudoviricetes sp.]